MDHAADSSAPAHGELEKSEQQAVPPQQTETSRDKVIAVDDLDEAEIRRRLERPGL